MNEKDIDRIWEAIRELQERIDRLEMKK